MYIYIYIKWKVVQNKDQKLIVMYFNINVSPIIMERLVLLHKLDTLVFFVFVFLSTLATQNYQPTIHS